MKPEKVASVLSAYGKLIGEHEELKRQYDLLQENFQKLLAHKVKKFILEENKKRPVDNSKVVRGG